jgi:hypothetical protein
VSRSSAECKVLPELAVLRHPDPRVPAPHPPLHPRSGVPAEGRTQGEVPGGSAGQTHPRTPGPEEQGRAGRGQHPRGVAAAQEGLSYTARVGMGRQCTQHTIDINK